MKRRARRRILVVTGTRAEYGVLRTVLQSIRRHPRLQLQLLVTGMHLVKRFGNTIDTIRQDGWRIDAAVAMQKGDDDSAGEGLAVGRGVVGIAKAIAELNSDIVLVVGDRTEALAGAVAGVCARRVVAHIHGGDRGMGDVDDSLRHAITKLAHVHLAASRDAARRVRRLGEDPRRIFVVGAPGLDEILAVRKPTRAWLQRTLNWTRPESYAVIVQHPSGRSAERERRDMRATLAAVSDAGLSGVIAYPNSDPGFSGIVAEIEATIRNGRVARTASDRPLNWHAARSFTRETYLRLLKGAAVLVGNSSSGIIESCCAGVPAVNIGDRQKGRLACGASVVHCRGDRPSILRAIQRAMRRQAGSDNSVYGDGQAGPRIATILARVPLDAAFRRKLITY